MTHDAPSAARECLFCAIVTGKAEASVVHKDEAVMVFMSLRPVTPGHLLVVPREHAVGLEDLDAATSAHVWSVGHDMARALRRSQVRCEGINVLLCDGEVAFQTVLHFHLHVIPRWAGDGWTISPDSAARDRSLLDSDARTIKDAVALPDWPVTAARAVIQAPAERAAPARPSSRSSAGTAGRSAVTETAGGRREASHRTSQAWKHRPVDTFAAITDERRAVADMLADLTAEQQTRPSLCHGWSVHDVAAHLVMPLEVGMPKFLLTMLVCRGDFDRANVRLTRQQARRPFDEIVEVLRRRAASRFTPPGSGPEAPLTDLLVHGLDIRWPLGLRREIPHARVQTSLTFLTTRSARGLVADGTLDGLRFEADDVDWMHGHGPTVSGAAEALLLALTGRSVALGALAGDGLPILRARSL